MNRAQRRRNQKLNAPSLKREVMLKQELTATVDTANRLFDLVIDRDIAINAVNISTSHLASLLGEVSTAVLMAAFLAEGKADLPTQLLQRFIVQTDANWADDIILAANELRRAMTDYRTAIDRLQEPDSLNDDALRW